MRTVAELKRRITLSDLQHREAQLAHERDMLRQDLAAIVADPFRKGWQEPEAAELDAKIRAVHLEWNAVLDRIQEEQAK